MFLIFFSFFVYLVFLSTNLSNLFCHSNSVCTIIIIFGLTFGLLSIASCIYHTSFYDILVQSFFAFRHEVMKLQSFEFDVSDVIPPNARNIDVVNTLKLYIPALTFHLNFCSDVWYLTKCG